MLGIAYTRDDGKLMRIGPITLYTYTVYFVLYTVCSIH